MRSYQKPLSMLLSIIILIGLFTAVPVSASDDTESIDLQEGTYVPNQVVVLFKNSAIDTDTLAKKNDLAAVGEDFGDMMDASSSQDEAYAAADEEIDILKKDLGDDFVLEDTLVFSDDDNSGLAATGAAETM